MKPKNIPTIIISAAMATLAQAAVNVTTPYFNTTSLNPDPFEQELEDPSFPYVMKASFDSSIAATHTQDFSVGGWSYADLRGTHGFTGGNPSIGWGHASSWFLLEIQQATRFTLSMDAVTAGADVHPGFVMFAGESIADDPSLIHRYSNDGSEMSRHDIWDFNGPGGTRGLTYVTHAANPSGNRLSHSVFLDPGLYTIAVGNIGDSGLTTGSKSYSVTLAVPEPSALLLSSAGALLLLRRRRVGARNSFRILNPTVAE